MEQAIELGVLVGSLRQGSYSRALAKALCAMAPAPWRITLIDIGKLPFYNQDDEAEPPAEWLAFRQQVAQCTALLFVTPEYNRSIPGVLKNAIDVGSRPFGRGVWSGKPAAVMSCSPGAVGGFGANHHLRQSLSCVGIPVMPVPEAYVGGIDKLLDAQGGIAVDSTRAFLMGFMQAFERWVARASAPLEA